MKPAPFKYHAPTALDSAIALLTELAPLDGRVLAGGQSLVPAMAFRLARPTHLIDINNIAALDHVTAEADTLSIGACVRHAAFHRRVVGGPLGSFLSDVVSHIAHYPIRIRGTFCGSLAHADPASEWCLVAATLGATIVARCASGARKITAENYFRGALTTALDANELITEVRLPLLPDDSKLGFYEFSRRAGDFALAMAAITYRLEGGVIVSPRIGIGGIEAYPRRLISAEAKLSGYPPSSKLFARAAEQAAAVVDPIDDKHGTANYRRDLARTVVFRALERSIA
jgi:aerobic carbon-monoxide dehydrogenase medium subunit